MVKAVSNSTPLIYLAKLNQLPNLFKVLDRLYIPEEVHQEVVVNGKALGKPEVVVIEEFIQKGFIEVRKAKPRSMPITTLHVGELAAISLASSMKEKWILVDDKEAVEACNVLGLQPHRTTTLLLEFLKRKLITPKEFESLLLQLTQAGYFLKADVFDYLVREARKRK